MKLVVTSSGVVDGASGGVYKLSVTVVQVRSLMDNVKSKSGGTSGVFVTLSLKD